MPARYPNGALKPNFEMQRSKNILGMLGLLLCRLAMRADCRACVDVSEVFPGCAEAAANAPQNRVTDRDLGLQLSHGSLGLKFAR